MRLWRIALMLALCLWTAGCSASTGGTAQTSELGGLTRVGFHTSTAKGCRDFPAAFFVLLFMKKSGSRMVHIILLFPS